MDDTFLGIDIANLVVHFGYAAVFLLIFLECVGVPLPGEITLVSAAVFAGATHRLEIGLVIAAAAIGAILGGTCGFWLGRRYGLEFLRRHGRYIHLTEPRLKIGQWLFRKYGGGIVFLGRFTALLRAYAALLAGANNYPAHRFFVWNTAGGAIWALAFGAGGFFFGHSVKYVAGPIGIILLAAAIIALFVLWLNFKKYETWLREEAEHSLEEPR